jgi:hypothetical protein
LVQNGRITSSNNSGLVRGGAKLTASATGNATTSVSAVASAAIQNDFHSRPR